MKAKHMLVAIALTATTLLPDAHAQSGPSPRKLNWDWLDLGYEVAYDNPYWEESREKSVWAARARASVALFPNLHLTGSYDEQHFDTAVLGIHTREKVFLGRYGIGTHADLGPRGALVLEVVREEANQKSHIDESGSQNEDSTFGIRGFGYYAGIRHLLGDTELELGYELSNFKDDLPVGEGYDPYRLKLKLDTLSVQLAAPLSKRLSATMRFEQLTSRAKGDQDVLGVHDESGGHFENVLFGLRFAL